MSACFLSKLRAHKPYPHPKYEAVYQAATVVCEWRWWVVQLALQRCELYGKDCADCCLARDPYCAWDGQTCSRYFHTNKRRARRQDVKYGDPWSQCHDIGDGSESVEVKVIYGVESNSTFLECVAHSQQTSIRWTLQHPQAQTSKELLQSEERLVRLKRGLLVQGLELEDAGLYTCLGQEHSYSKVLARYSLQVIPRHHLTSPGPGRGPGRALADRHSEGLRSQLLQRNYKELQLEGATGLSVDEYCEQLWYREKRRQQKLRTLKWKQSVESRKARVRRHNPPRDNPPYDNPPYDNPSQ
ncbi:semaphorin-3D-like [Hypomesus transpacificus]|uniref:semaphorin-3D-like n=1 Tax=Hypomesus transpacificus TaxID=137520 RepID=UPI001F0807B4|nr:semaphorin-3D-like [Hypomesus transpacificus]